MFAYILRRCGHAVVVVFGVSLVVFLLARLAPGDPVTLMLAETASPQQIEEARRHYGLDRPLPAQYALFLGNAVRGDMGESLYYKQPALRVVLEAFPQTALLAVTALLLAIVVALPLGILAAVRRDTFWDYLAVGLAVLGQAAPAYWVGIMLILVFSVALGVLPTSGNATPQALILPAVTLGAALMAVLTRLTRAGMLDVLNEDYISHGAGERVARTRDDHAPRPAECADPAGDGRGVATRGSARRRGDHRAGFRLARRGATRGDGDHLARLPNYPGGGAARLLYLRRRQSAGRYRLRFPRSAYPL